MEGQQPLNGDNQPGSSSQDDAGLRSPPDWSPETRRLLPSESPAQGSSSRPSIFSSSSTSLFSSGTGRTHVNPDSAPPRPSIITTRPSTVDLGTPTRSSIVTPRRTARFEPMDTPTSSSRALIPSIEKEIDDPTTPRRTVDRRDTTTLEKLSRLFAAQAITSPDSSRAPSYNRPPTTPYQRSIISQTPQLRDHLYSKGLLQGRHSDITVIAFGKRYNLHKLIIDRAPFFQSALSEPWIESTAKEITLKPEEIDSSITQTAFELAIKRLYEAHNPEEEDTEACGLFATGCWLEMQDLIDASVESMLRQMTPRTLSPLIRLVTSNYYGRAGDKLLHSAKAMLCRDGWEMPLSYWDEIPGDIIREIVGGDGFFIESEWDRWVLAKRLLDRRLKNAAIAAELAVPIDGRYMVLKAPETLGLMAVRFDGTYRKNSIMGTRGIPDSHHAWIALYTSPDIEPLLVLLDEGIHYMHLSFEQLQYIRNAKDILGLPVMPEKIITNALWQGMELRQKVLGSRDTDMELGLSNDAEEVATAARPSQSTIVTEFSAKGKGKMNEDAIAEDEEEDEEIPSDSWDNNAKPRKFWIPSTDCNIVMGGNAEPVVTTSSAARRHANRLSASLQPEDAQWATDFAASTAGGEPRTARPPSAQDNRPVSYSNFPPFRFSAEFPNPRLLKEKKRVYSRTVFYAGSLWNIYIQKVRSSKNPQLGVYLHRAKERETDEGVVAGSSGINTNSTVDERIGLLEREMLLRSQRRSRRSTGRGLIRPSTADGDVSNDSGSGGDPEISLANPSSSAYSANMHRLLRHSPNQPKTTSSLSGIFIDPDPPIPPLDSSLYPTDDTDPTTSDDEADEFDLPLPRAPTMPAYTDARPTIKTYFKIYSPSKGGRMLSVYESAPDQFNFSQSWGWKSSTLMLDEGLWNGNGRTDGDAEGALAGVGGEAEGVSGEGRRERSGEGMLRFMVVVGNV